MVNDKWLVCRSRAKESSVVGQRQGKTSSRTASFVAVKRQGNFRHGKGKLGQIAMASFRHGKWQMATGKSVTAKDKGLRSNGKGKLCRSTAKGIGFVTLRQRNSGQMAKAKESSTANSSGHGREKVPSMARKVVRRQRERLRHCRAREKESFIDPRQIFTVTARQVCCCFRSVRTSGHTACDHKGKTSVK